MTLNRKLASVLIAGVALTGITATTADAQSYKWAKVEAPVVQKGFALPRLTCTYVRQGTTPLFVRVCRISPGVAKGTPTVTFTPAGAPRHWS